ncbi:MAG: HNH endonuclease signature motif containing protein [bacterium]
MERSVVARKGAGCVVPGCFANYNTLAFRIPIARGGKVSADNLIPVCSKHARELAAKGYDEWVAELKARQFNEPSATSFGAAPEIEPPPFITPPIEPGINYVQPIAQGYDVQLTPLSDKRPVIIAPFLRGRVKKLIFDYQWQLKGKGSCKVFVVAWPRGEKPYLQFLDSDDFKGTAAEKEHQTNEDTTGNSSLTLELPPSPLGRWVAAVVLSGEGNFSLQEYVLAGTD